MSRQKTGYKYAKLKVGYKAFDGTLFRSGGSYRIVERGSEGAFLHSTKGHVIAYFAKSEIEVINHEDLVQ